MTLGIIDLQNFDINLTSLQFGTLTLKNYGEAGVSAAIESIDENLYNEKLGAFGDMMVSKNYKAANKLLKIQVLRNSPDYARLQAVIAAEEAGQSIIFAVNCRDSYTKESYTSPGGVFKKVSAFESGSDVSADMEFTILMPSTVHIPPIINLNVVANV